MNTEGWRGHVGLLILVSLPYLLPGLFASRDFWVADEARYADVLREMTENGRWLVTYLNGDFYPDKPPVYFWLCAGLSRLAGAVTPTVCLVVTWLSSLGTVLTTYALARSIGGARAALLGALALASTLLFLICAQVVRMDMLLACFVALAVLAFREGYRRKSPAWYALFYLAAGLGVLTKGPLGFALPFLPAVVFLVWRREWREAIRFVFGPGILVAILLVGGWLGAAWLGGEQAFVRDLFVTQIAGRAVKAFSHPEPFYFYLVLLPFILSPWAPFLVRAVGSRKRPLSDDHLLLLLWFALGFLVISAISGKLFIYVLPLVPPLMIMLGEFLAEVLDRRRSTAKAFVAEGIMASVLSFGLLGGALAAAQWIPPWNEVVPWWVAAVLLAAGVVGVGFSLQRRAAALFVLLLAGVGLTLGCGVPWLANRVNDNFSSRAISGDIARYTAAGREVAASGVIPGIFSFYAGQPVPMVPEGDIVPYLEQPGRVVVTVEKEYRIRQAVLDRRARVAGRRQLAGRTYIILESK